MAKDPICGMDVDEKKAKHTAAKGGKTFYFCSKHCQNSFLGAKAPAFSKNENETITLPVSGMTCASCAAKIEKKVKSLKGVAEANANLATEKVTVSFSAEKIKREKIEGAIEQLGYKVRKEIKEGLQSIKLRISGMDNPHCVSIVDSALKSLDGVNSAQLLVNEKASISFDSSRTGIEQIKKKIRDAGYEPFEEEAQDNEKAARKREIKALKIKLIVSMIFSLPLLYFAMSSMFSLPIPSAITDNFALVQFLLATPVMMVGYEFFTKGLRSVFMARTANMDTLVAVGTGTAYIYSLFVSFLIWSKNPNYGHEQLYFEIAAVLIAFILLGRYLEAVAKGKTSEAIKKLAGLAAKTAIVVRNGKELEISISEVKAGDTIIVKPGQKIPVDGVIIEGESSIDESMVTGESIPVDKKKGNIVIGATINKSGSFKFKATKVGKDTLLAQIIKFVEDAQGSKAPIQKLADQISAIFVPVVVAIALISLATWLMLGFGLNFALTSFVSVLIIACPCAMGLATPTAVMVATGMGAERGILIKNAEALQKASSIDTIVFDKTGTLTKGKPEVTDILPAFGKKEQVLLYAAIAEKRSEHALGEAILNKAKSMKVRVPDAKSFHTVSGKGVIAKYNGKDILLGNRLFMRENRIDVSGFSAKSEKLEEEGKTVVYLSADRKLSGIIAIMDTPKEDAKEAVSQLKKMNKEVIMITGDNERTGNAVARQVGITTVLSEVLPEQKAEEIKKLQQKGRKVAMVGDGINDAPALSQADLGIAMGSGTDIAIEAGEIILVRKDLRGVAASIRLSTYAMSKIKQNLFWAFVYNIGGIPVAAGILYPITGFLLSPIIAGAAMAMSSVSVLTNSLMMKRWKG